MDRQARRLINKREKDDRFEMPSPIVEKQLLT